MNDLELMYLLDENGYKPTIKNLKILKEGLETGKYEILDEGLGKLYKPAQDPTVRRNIARNALRQQLGRYAIYDSPEATERSRAANIKRVEKLAAEHGLTLDDLKRKR